MSTQIHCYSKATNPHPWEVAVPSLHDPLQNYLLAALPPDAQDRLFPELELVELKAGQILQGPDHIWRHAYFPITCIISKLYLLETGANAEIGVIGNEGMVSISLFMGGESMANQTVVKSGGYAYKVRGQLVKDEFERSADIQKLFLRYTQALITQMAQTAACNRHHTVDQQLCRWLLQSQDRLTTNELVMTHELIANMLGVRREGISEAAGNLQSAGLIKYSRGHIHILQRKGLEDRSCECYDMVKREFERLLPELAAA